MDNSLTILYLAVKEYDEKYDGQDFTTTMGLLMDDLRYENRLHEMNVLSRIRTYRNDIAHHNANHDFSDAEKGCCLEDCIAICELINAESATADIKSII